MTELTHPCLLPDPLPPTSALYPTRSQPENSKSPTSSLFPTPSPPQSFQVLDRPSTFLNLVTHYFLLLLLLIVVAATASNACCRLERRGHRMQKSPSGFKLCFCYLVIQDDDLRNLSVSILKWAWWNLPLMGAVKMKWDNPCQILQIVSGVFWNINYKYHSEQERQTFYDLRQVTQRLQAPLLSSIK